MKFSLKSNYNDFIKRLSKIPEAVDIETQSAMNTLLSEMCESMKQIINSERATWFEYGSPLSAISGDDITYSLTDDGTGGIIYVGKNTEPFEMSDGRTVNPYLFIQFGFGIQGQNNPVQYATQRRWEYNINEHTKGWAFIGIDDEPHWTTGRIGIDFFYRVIEEYKEKWKEVLTNAYKKNELLKSMLK